MKSDQVIVRPSQMDFVQRAIAERQLLALGESDKFIKDALRKNFGKTDSINHLLIGA